MKINSRILGTLNFLASDNGGYVLLISDEGRSQQIHDGGDFSGRPVTTTPETFRRDCLRWARQRRKIYAENEREAEIERERFL